ncbi:cobyrinate a,c-diamide synthase [Pseudonocardia acaciae]|uniref:cobyrinate a,c-diamide synthase n=1 Tax=Pseudonocardia acaciae TaxID=551276 RepID=UPI00048CD498|nr:cobyrinate a,c-diamide synthase [Pseudonocardia acaciae]
MTRVIVIAAAASGSGKTTVATGLMAALRRRGTTVAPFKVGPDYIDPGYHALATGRPGRNLDPVLVGEHRIGPLFRHGAAGAEVAVVEGVMGLFDGRLDADPLADGSTAHVAGLLGAPVLLVVDARGQSRSLAALLHGFASYRPGTRLAGVVLNQVGSSRHEAVLREACAEVGLAVLGALPRRDALAVPSRHLGLVTAAESGPAATEAVAAMAELVAGHVDLDAVLAAAVTGPVAPAWDPAAEVGETAAGRPVVAVAGGTAFSFGYAEHPELLAAAGAEVAVFDPLRDESPPPGTAGLVLPGGFPEEHGAGLAANAALRASVAAAARAGAPVHAECGGLLYLASELDGHPMCGVLPAVGRMTPRLRLGYRDAVALTDSAPFRAGQRVTGHEFHRTTLEPASDDSGPAWRWTQRGAPAEPEGYVRGRLHASYLHTHPAGQPETVARFVAECARFAASR